MSKRCSRADCRLAAALKENVIVHDCTSQQFQIPFRCLWYTMHCITAELSRNWLRVLHGMLEYVQFRSWGAQQFQNSRPSSAFLCASTANVGPRFEEAQSARGVLRKLSSSWRPPHDQRTANKKRTQPLNARAQGQEGKKYLTVEQPVQVLTRGMSDAAAPKQKNTKEPAMAKSTASWFLLFVFMS
jgi:hypothetical protein